MKYPVITTLLSIILVAVLLWGLAFGLQSTATNNAQEEHLTLMQTLLPGSKTFTLEPYNGENPAVQTIHKGETGFVVETVTQGYADEITLLVGVSNEGTVTGLVVKEMHETCGLGQEGLTNWEFLMQFLKTDGSAQIGDGVDALTGATVTSKAITRCVNAAVAAVTGTETDSGTDADSGATSWGG